MYVKKEVAKKLMQLKLENMNNAVTKFDSVIESLEKFNGKQLNKRIDTALKKIDNNIHAYSQYNSFIIEISFFNNRSFNLNNNWYYLDDYKETLCHCCLESSYGDGVLQNGAFDYAVAKNQLLKRKQSLIDNIAEATKQLDDINNIISEYNKLNETIKQFNNSINCEIKNIYQFDGLDAYNWTHFE